MRKNDNKKNVQIEFFLSTEEVEFWEKKMQATGIRNKSAYFCKMTRDGYIVNMDFSELDKFITARKSGKYIWRSIHTGSS